MEIDGGIRIDELMDHKAVQIALSALRDGDPKWLKVYDDEYIREYSNADDYALWLSEKAKHGIVHSRYEVPPES